MLPPPLSARPPSAIRNDPCPFSPTRIGSAARLVVLYSEPLPETINSPRAPAVDASRVIHVPEHSW